MKALASASALQVLHSLLSFNSNSIISALQTGFFKQRQRSHRFEQQVALTEMPASL